MHIIIDAVTKQYPGGVTALQDVGLEIRPGMFGLLGPNGAGKSTLMQILATLEPMTSGRITIDGQPLDSNRRLMRSSLGYLPQAFGVYPQLTGYEFIAYLARLNGVPGNKIHQRTLDVLQQVALADVRDRKAKTYSGGMLRRLGIAQAIVHDPDVLIVDEPTVGLDPEERIRFRNLLSDIGKRKTILLSTHIVGDISSTCEDIAILGKGSIIFRGKPARLIEAARGQVWLLKCPEPAFSEIANSMQVISTIPRHDYLLMRVVGEPPEGFDVEAVAPNLEDAYIYHMDVMTGERVTAEEPIDA